jgi:hypothetical protein
MRELFEKYGGLGSNPVCHLRKGAEGNPTGNKGLKVSTTQENIVLAK